MGRLFGRGRRRKRRCVGRERVRAERASHAADQLGYVRLQSTSVIRPLLLAALATSLMLAPSHREPAAAAGASPCVTATATCTEWVAVGGGSARSMVYRTYSLASHNDGIRRALVMVHGTNR